MGTTERNYAFAWRTFKHIWKKILRLCIRRQACTCWPTFSLSLISYHLYLLIFLIILFIPQIAEDSVYHQNQKEFLLTKIIAVVEFFQDLCTQ